MEINVKGSSICIYLESDISFKLSSTCQQGKIDENLILISNNSKSKGNTLILLLQEQIGSWLSWGSLQLGQFHGVGESFQHLIWNCPKLSVFVSIWASTIGWKLHASAIWAEELKLHSEEDEDEDEVDHFSTFPFVLFFNFLSFDGMFYCRFISYFFGLLDRVSEMGYWASPIVYIFFFNKRLGGPFN